MKDKAGRELKTGDFIVYGHALGRCAGLQYGIILVEDNGKGHITVRGVDTDWEHHAPRLLKKSTLLFGERILRVNSNQIPPRIQDILSQAYADEFAEG